MTNGMTLRVYDVRGQSTLFKLQPDSRVLYWDSPLSSSLVGSLFTPLFPLLDPFLPSRLALKKMAISISDASLASAVHAGPWWRHRGMS